MTNNLKISFLFSHFEKIIELDINFKSKLSFAINHYFKNNKQLGSKDRKFLNILIYNYFRYKLSFETIENIDSFELFLLNFRMCEKVLKKSDTFAYILKEFDEFLRENTELSETLNQVFSKMTEKIEDFDKTSFPPLFQSQIEQFDSSLFNCLNIKPPVSVRSIFEKDGTQQIESELVDLQIEYTKNQLGTLDLSTYSNFENHFNTNKISFEIQDNGSFIISKFISELKSNTIIDACAGSGGKALSISYFDSTKSIDIYDSDVKRLKEFNNRSFGKHKNITVLKDLNTNKKYDLVLIDAPCSGAGTIRRNPAKRFTITEDVINEFNAIQSNIINKYAEFVSDYGLLVYVTCSIFDKENIDVVNDFLNNNKNFIPFIQNESILDNYSIKITNFANILIPINYNGDIFFIAVLQRISEKKDD